MKTWYLILFVVFGCSVAYAGHTVRTSHTSYATASSSNGDHVETRVKTKTRTRYTGASTGSYGSQAVKAKTRTVTKSSCN